MVHPYRDSARPSTGMPSRPDERSWACGELTIAVMLAAVGCLGVVMGFTSTASDTELSLGLLLFILGVKVFVDERRSRSSRDHSEVTPPIDR